MLEATGWFLLGLVLLALGGDSVVRGASGLAQRAGASPFVTGLLLVAFATSLPELAVNVHAIVEGRQALALGNAVGSNVVNFGLTLGVAAWLAPMTVRWRALTPLLVVLMLGTAAAIAMGLDGALSRVEGGVLLAAFAAAFAFALRRTRGENADVRAEIERYARTSTGLGQNLLRVAIAVALLYFGSRLIVEHAPVLGLGLGMTPLVTGLLLVAIGTALPELAAAIAAARRGQGDMVAGHVIGSSVFNLLLVVGGMALFRPLPLPPSFVRFELPAALAFALMLYPMLRGDQRFSKAEGGILVAALLAWIGFELLLIHA